MVPHTESSGGGWLAQRECSLCHFTGCETEFMAVGITEDDAVVIVHRDDALDYMTPICCGCAAGLGRLSSKIMRQTLWALLLRPASRVLDEAEAKSDDDPDEPIPYAFTYAAKAAGW